MSCVGDSWRLRFIDFLVLFFIPRFSYQVVAHFLRAKRLFRFLFLFFFVSSRPRIPSNPKLFATPMPMPMPMSEAQLGLAWRWGSSLAPANI